MQCGNRALATLDVGDIRRHDLDPQRLGRRRERRAIGIGIELVAVLRARKQLGALLRTGCANTPLACGDRRQQKWLELR